MLKKTLVAAAVMLLGLAQVAQAYTINRQGNGSYAINWRTDTLEIQSSSGYRYTFARADVYGENNACPSYKVNDMLNSYPYGDTRRISGVDSITGLMSELESREHDNDIYWEIIDCGKPLGGRLSGLLCIDFESSWADNRRIFEACANVTQYS